MSTWTTTTVIEPRAVSAPTVETSSSPVTAGLAAWSLARRELVRFLRQRTRIVGALGQPFLFWILFGAGLQGSFRGPGGESYQEYFFSGVAVMIVLFTAIFSTISIIEDRREGFLQGVLVAPVPRWSIVLGKLLGGTILAVGQTLVFLLVGPLLAWLGLSPEIDTGVTWWNLPAVVGWLTLLGLSLTGLGFLIAWPMESTHGFHAIMSVFLLPMWLLSGAIFPAAEVGWLRGIMACNPLTYGVAGLRRILAVDAAGVAALPSWSLCFLVTVTFGLVCLAAAVGLTNRPMVRNSR